MARYRVAEGRQLSHSERVDVQIPTYPQPTVAEGYERRDLEAGDELELNDADGKRLLEAGVVECFNVPAKRRKPAANKARKVSANKM
ncbi:MAG: hypothetical protein M3360_05955 [Actinomycetota bacterium]|nr:hypothetical protein [Actinomycetota bacterium]